MGDYVRYMGTTRPSTIRHCVLEQHDALARKLDHVQQACAALAAAGHASAERAVALARQLYQEFTEHLEFEDRLLVPALRESDAWGDVRAEQLREQHGAQRAELLSLPLDEPCSVEPCALAARLVAIIETLRDDIRREEQVVLADEVLRDDVIEAGNEAG